MPRVFAAPAALSVATITVTVAVAAIAALPAAAHAQQAARPRRPGTFFLLQGSGGIAADSSAEPTFGLTFGMGGKLRGFPPRFYVLLETARSGSAASGELTTGSYAAAMDGVDLAAGLRVLVPLSGPLRVYGDVLVGGTRGSWTLARPGFPERAAEDWTELVDLAGGMEVRMHRNFAAGLRYKAHLLEDTPRWLAGLGVRATRRGDLTATVTCFF